MNTKKNVAFIYGGQGAQHATMAEELMQIPKIQTFFQTMEDTLNVPLMSWFDDPEAVHATESVQLLLFVVQEAWTQVLRDKGITPHAVAGQSLGEYNALLSAQVNDLETLAHLVKERGAAMATCLTPKTIMKAVIGDLANLNQLLDNSGLYLSNENSPKQVVIGGTPAAFDAIKTLPKGIKRLLPLKTQAAFHTPYIAPAKEALTASFNAITYHTPALDLYQNLTGQKTSQVQPADLLDHLVSPVRFGSMIQSMVEADVELFIEISPTPSLQKLIQQNAPHQTVRSVHSRESLDTLVSYFKGAPHA